MLLECKSLLKWGPPVLEGFIPLNGPFIKGHLILTALRGFLIFNPHFPNYVLAEISVYLYKVLPMSPQPQLIAS